MTYREYLTITLSKFNLSEQDIDLILVEQASSIPDADAIVDVRVAKMAMVRSIAAWLPVANVGEGGYSVSWNMDALKAWYQAQCADLGEDPKFGKPLIRNKSYLW